MRKLPVNRLHAKRWIVVDNFAGGGGASTGIELAIGRSPDVAINHDPEALAMHKANHPHTRHYATDVFEVDPRVVVRDKRVGLAWFSPDCTHHSKARGGKPIREAGKKSRALAWVVVNWARVTRPRVIMLENVEEFAQWGPLIKTPKGLRPCPARRGQTFRRWVRALERLGYRVEWKELRACDYGTPTTRKRLFVIARCDNRPIVWPKPTHGKPGSAAVESGELLPWRSAASIIDWSLPCPSIFLETSQAQILHIKRPLAENTLKRIAAGLKRYVINAAKPFIVSCNHGSGDRFRGQSIDDPAATVTGSKGDALVMPFLASPAHSTTTGRAPNVWDMEEPLRTVTGANDKMVVAPFAVPRYSERDGQAPRSMSIESPLSTIVPDGNGASLVAPFLQAYHGPRPDESTSRSVEMGEPLRTVDTQNRFGMVQAFLAQHNTGVVGHPADKPLSTITGRGTQQQVVSATIVGCGGRAAQSSPQSLNSPLPTITSKADKCIAAAYLSHQYTSNTGGGQGDVELPLKTVMAGGQHHIAVKAFLQKYYGSGGQDQSAAVPLHTVPSKARMSLVTVDEIDFEIVDIGMRMLTARELFRAQGFPDSYRLEVPAPNKQGKVRTLPKDAQVRMCGNSVCPQLAKALVEANCPWLRETVKDSSKKPARRERQLELAGV